MAKLLTINLLKKLDLIQVFSTLCVFYLYLLVIEYFVPEGINKTFLLNMNAGTLYLILFLIPVIAVSYLMFKNINTNGLLRFELPRLSDMFLVLLPLASIMQYVLLNQDTLSLYGSLYLLCVFVLAAIVLIIVLPVVLSVGGSRVIFMSFGLAITFILFYMATLSFDNSWHDEGSLKIQLTAFLIVFLMSVLIYQKNHKFLKAGIVAFFVSNTLVILSSLPPSTLEEEANKNPFLNSVAEKTMAIKPDIYLLTYDSYVGNETMLQYGIDNSAQESYLNDKGFKVYDGIYSIAGATNSTMTRVLDASSMRHKSALAGNSYTHNALKHQGYTLAGVHKSASFWNKSHPKLDYFYPGSKNHEHEIILNSILEGEFQFDAPKKFGKVKYEEFISRKRNFMSSSSHPKFLYTHTGPDHSQNSGKCRVNETVLFERRLFRSNKEMKKDIETIENNNPNALIIINGDHGPYLTGNCDQLSKNNFMPKEKVSRLNLQDRYGTFLAIKWPKTIEVLDSDIVILQDIFPAIFATLFKDKSILNEVQIPRNTLEGYVEVNSGVAVKNGIIFGGIDDGQPLFLNSRP